MRRNLKRRLLAGLLSACMIFQTVGMVPVYAMENAADSGVPVGTSAVCENHTEHTSECGYVEGTEGAPCTHEHTEDCYVEVEKCVHEHTDECYPATDDEEATGSEAKEPTECAHVCDEASGCITQELDCQHEHDEECGYVEAVEGSPCTHSCELCATDGEEADEEATEEIIEEDTEETKDGEDNVITAFADLDNSVKEQALPLGAKESDIVLPMSLQVTVDTDGDMTDDRETTLNVEVTWEIDPDNSAKKTFDSGIAPEEYFGVDEDGKVNYAGATQEQKDAYEDMNGACYTYVPVIPEGYTLAEGVDLPKIFVMVGETNINLLTVENAVAEVTYADTSTEAKQFADLAEALTEASNHSGSTLTLLQDVTTTTMIEVTTGENCTIDLCGKTWTGNIPSGYFLLEIDGGSWTIKDSVGNGQMVSNNKAIWVDSGTLTIEGGGYQTKYDVISLTHTGTLIINNGTFTTSSNSSYYCINASTTSTDCIINNGTFGMVYTGSAGITLNGGSFEYGILAEENCARNTIGKQLGTNKAYQKSDESWVTGAENDVLQLEESLTVKDAPVSITKIAATANEVTYGNTTTLSVEVVQSAEAAGKVVTYQWFKDGVSLGDTACAATYTTATDLPIKEGAYSFYCVATCDGYSSTSEPVAVTVKQATGKVGTLAIQGWTYGDIANAPTSTSQTNNTTPKYEYKLSTVGDDAYKSDVPTDAGSYTLKVTYPATENYTEASDTIEFTIAKKTVTPSITGTAEKIYDGTTEVETGDLSISLTGVIDSDTSKIGATADYTYASVNVGTGITVTASNISLTGDASGNYQLSTPTGTVAGSITARTITDTMVTGLEATYYYTGSAIEPTVTISDIAGGIELLKASDYDIAYSANTDIGTNTGIITITGKGNYTGTVTRNFSIAYVKAPTDYIQGAGGTNDWYTSDVTISKEGWLVSQNGTDYMQSVSVTTEGTTALTLYFKNAQNQITEGTNISIKIDKTAPTGKITLASKWWETALNFLSFDRYQAMNKTITIEGTDTVSGVSTDAEGSTVSYAIVTGDTQYTTVEALEEAAENNASFWTKYNSGSKPSVNANEDFVIYAKIADQAGNSIYISSNGMLFDETAPDIAAAAVSGGEDAVTDTSVRFDLTVDEAGYYYYVVLPSTAAAPLNAADVIATVNAKTGASALGAEGGTNLTDAVTSGSGSCTAGTMLTVTASGLNATTAYKIYIVATDMPMTNIDDQTGTQTVNVSTAAIIDDITTKKTSLAGATVTLTGTEDFVYDGTAKIPAGITVTLGDTTLAPEQYTVSYANSNPAATGKETTYAGTVAVTILASDTGDYSGTVTKKPTYVIAPKPLTANVTADSKVYDTKTDATVNATVNTDIADEALTITGLTGTYTDADAGIDKSINIDSTGAEVTAADSTRTEPSNYKVTYPASIKGDIAQATGAITIPAGMDKISVNTWDSKTLEGITKTGDGTLTYTVSDSKDAAGTGVANDQIITVVDWGWAMAVGGYNAGTATITIAMEATTNYTAAESKTISVTVNKLPAPAITPEDRSYAYSAGSRGQAVEISMADKLPDEGYRGTTGYQLTAQTDTHNILSDVSVDAATGVLSYKVASGTAIGDSASITVTAIMNNYNDATFTVNISITDQTLVEMKSGSEVKLTGGSTLTYGQSLSELTLNTSGTGKAVFVEAGTDTVVEGTLAWTDAATKPDATAEGSSYSAEWTFTPSDTSCAVLTGTLPITVNQAAGKVENKADSEGYAAGYTFTGREIAAPVSTQFTTNSGSTGFTFTWYQGSVSEANKLAENTRPSAVGKYVLKVDVAETANYTAASTTLDVTIKNFVPDPGVAATLADTNLGTDGWYHGDVTVNAPSGYTISTTQSPVTGFAGSITVAADMNDSFTYYLKQDVTGYITDAKTITVKKDTAPPTAGIQVKETWWQSFLETVTFGLYTNDKDTITIKSEDTAGAAHSGISKTEYYISSTAYVGDSGLTSLKALDSSQWKEYNSGSKPTVLQNQISYVYVRVTDKAGNVNYVSTDGIVQDETAPALTLTPSGTAYTDTNQNPYTYIGTVTVTATASDAVAGQDTLETIQYVLDHGTAQSLTSGGTISITGNGIHTLTVTAADKAGNQTVEELTLRIYADAPVITLNQAGTVTYDGDVISEGTDFTLNKGGSAGSVSYRHKVQGTDDSTYVTGLPINAGSYTIEATVAEDGTNCYKAGSATGDITISKATPVINLGATVSRADGIQLVLTATVGKAGNGAVPTGTVKFVDVTTGSAVELGTVTLANGTASYTYTGLAEKVYKLQVSYDGNDNYNTVTSTEQSVDTAKQNQTALSISNIGAKTYGDTTFNLSTTGGSGTGAVTYVSSDSSILSITGTTATILKAGTVTITATKAADNDYNETTAATSITITKKALTITAQNQLNIIKGSAMPAFTYASDGLVNGDTVTTAPAMSCSAADTNTLGEFTIFISGAIVRNQDSYNITYANGKMTVVNQVYTVNVVNGTATVDASTVTKASEGQILTLTAENRDGYTFKNWSSNAGGSFDNVNAKTTTFTMPASDVTITANYTKNSSGNDSGNSDNGGSGASGGSSSPESSSPESNSTTSTDIPTTGKAEVKADVDQNGNAAVSVTDQTVADAIRQAQDEARKNGTEKNGISVVISIDTNQDAATISATLPRSVQEQLTAAGVNEFKLVSKNVEIGLNLNAIRQITATANADVTITASKADNSRLSAEAQTASGGRPVYDFKATYVTTVNGKQQTGTISQFGNGSVSIAIPYTLGANEKAGSLYGIYIDSKGKVTYITNSSYDVKTGKMIFGTNHFSYYGIGYKADTEETSFTDIAGHWAENDIEFAAVRGLLTETAANTFGPNLPMTRGMLVTALGRLAEADVSGYTVSSFTDVAADADYMGYVEWAFSKGIVKGTSAATFAPEQTVTREELAVMMADYAEAMGYTMPRVNVEITFSDSTEISTWAMEAIKSMQMAGVISGKDGGCFDPKGIATRAEVSAVLHRFVELSIDTANAQGWTKNDSGHRMYYRDGSALTGWQTVDGLCYFFNADGVMHEGWKQAADGTWHYFNNDGAVIGWAGIEGKRYYFGSDGVMLAGQWIEVDGKWYYLKEDGTMAVNTTIDGYEVNEKGVSKTAVEITK